MEGHFKYLGLASLGRKICCQKEKKKKEEKKSLVHCFCHTEVQEPKRSLKSISLKRWENRGQRGAKAWSQPYVASR
jgi:hypothetical protein